MAPRVPTHSEEVVDAARRLGRISRRGKPWQLTAEVLFNAGSPLSDVALRETTKYLMRAEQAGMARAWAAAAEAPPPEVLRPEAPRSASTRQRSCRAS